MPNITNSGTTNINIIPKTICAPDSNKSIASDIYNYSYPAYSSCLHPLNGAPSASLRAKLPIAIYKFDAVKYKEAEFHLFMPPVAQW